jgi:hypothetical protein
MSIYQTLLNNLEPKLPALVGGSDWNNSGQQITQLIRELHQAEDNDIQEALLYQLVGILENYPNAFRAGKYEYNVPTWRDVYDETTFQKDVSTILPTHIIQSALEQSYNATALVFVPGEVNRGITLTPGESGKSVKFSNFRIDIGEMAEIAGGAFLAGHEAIKEPHPLILAAGLLLTVRALLKAMTVEINEQDTSVFWGFVQASDKEKIATTAAIFSKTKSERERFGLKPLTENQFKGSLEKLKQLKAIENVGDDKWRIIEDFYIPD